MEKAFSTSYSSVFSAIWDKEKKVKLQPDIKQFPKLEK